MVGRRGPHPDLLLPGGLYVRRITLARDVKGEGGCQHVVADHALELRRRQRDFGAVHGNRRHLQRRCGGDQVHPDVVHLDGGVRQHHHRHAASRIEGGEAAESSRASVVPPATRIPQIVHEPGERDAVAAERRAWLASRCNRASERSVQRIHLGGEIREHVVGGGTQRARARQRIEMPCRHRVHARVVSRRYPRAQRSRDIDESLAHPERPCNAALDERAP